MIIGFFIGLIMFLFLPSRWAYAECCTSCDGPSGVCSGSCISLPWNCEISSYVPCWYSRRPVGCEVSAECGNLILSGCGAGGAGTCCCWSCTPIATSTPVPLPVPGNTSTPDCNCDCDWHCGSVTCDSCCTKEHSDNSTDCPVEGFAERCKPASGCGGGVVEPPSYELMGTVAKDDPSNVVQYSDYQGRISSSDGKTDTLYAADIWYRLGHWLLEGLGEDPIISMTFTMDTSWLPVGYTCSWVHTRNDRDVVLESGDGCSADIGLVSENRLFWYVYIDSNHSPEITGLSIFPDVDPAGTPRWENLALGQTAVFTGQYTDVDDPNDRLVNGSFESDFNFWHRGDVHYAIFENSGAMWATKYLETSRNTGAGNVGEEGFDNDFSFYQDVTIPAGSAGTTYSLSVWGKTKWPGTKTADVVIYEATPAGWQGSSTNVTFDQNWQNVQLTRQLIDNESTVLRIQIYLNTTEEYNFDGFLLEAGSFEPEFTGIYSDLSATQVSIDNGVADPTSWPMIMRFSPQEGFQAYSSPLGIDFNPVNSIQPDYDSVLKRWYLPSNISLGTYANILGGGGNTYAQFNGNNLNVNWKVEVLSGFPPPATNYNVTLLAKDLDNRYDQTALDDGQSSVFSVGSAYYHRMGTVDIDDAFGTISGNVWSNSVSQACDAGTPESRFVTITGSGYNCVVVSDGGSYTSDGCSPQPTRGNTYQVSVAYDSSSETCNYCPSASCSTSVNLPDVDGSSATANFTVFPGGQAWYQGRGVSVLAGNSIETRVPVTCAVDVGCSQAVTIDWGGYQNNGIVMSNSVSYSSGCNWCGSGDCCLRGIDNDWWKSPYVQDIRELDYNRMYTELFENRGVGRTATNWAGVRGVGGTGLVFVGGDLDISRVGTGNIVPVGEFLMVVVNGDITVDDVTERIEGAFIADNLIISGDSASGMLINGMIYTRDSMSLGRSYTNTVSNNTSPAVRVVMRPDLIFNAPSYLFERLRNIR